MAFTTKYRIAEQVLLELNKRSYDSDITIQQVMLKVNQGLATLARNRYFISKQDDVENIDGGLIFTFKNIAVEQDEDTLEYFITLPGTSMSLPYGLGIHQVSPMKSPKISYRAVTPGFNALFEGLPSANLEGWIGYYMDNDKLMFVNMDGTNNPSKALLKMLLPLDGIDDDSPLNIPMDMQDECINYIVDKYMNTPIKDTTGDNVDQA